jgi:hypothetical protein
MHRHRLVVDLAAAALAGAAGGGHAFSKCQLQLLAACAFSTSCCPLHSGWSFLYSAMPAGPCTA